MSSQKKTLEINMGTRVLDIAEIRQVRLLLDKAMEKIGSEKSTIVVLPEGAGKTDIACRAALHEEGLAGRKTLLITSTNALANRWASELEPRLKPLRVAKTAKGRKQSPSLADFNVLVSTPDAFLKNEADGYYFMESFGLFIVDEVHNALKCRFHRELGGVAKKKGVKLLGLSALLAENMAQNKLEDDVLKLCKELGVTRDDVLSIPGIKLQHDGNNATAAAKQAQVGVQGQSSSAIAPSLLSQPSFDAWLSYGEPTCRWTPVPGCHFRLVLKGCLFFKKPPRMADSRGPKRRRFEPLPFYTALHAPKTESDGCSDPDTEMRDISQSCSSGG